MGQKWAGSGSATLQLNHRLVCPGTVTPLLAWLTVKRLVVDPYQARKREQEQLRRREANKEKVAEARREALASASLMAERFRRSVCGK